MSLGDWYLNGTKLCPWNFSYSEGKEVIGGDVRNLAGAARRDVVARKKTVEMSWEYLPETFDGTYHGYSDLETIGTSATTGTLIRPTGTGTGTTQYTVLCDPPSGVLQHRTDSVDVYWNVSMAVREV